MEQEAGPGLTQASVWCRCLTDGLPSSGASRPGPLSSPHSASTPHCTPTEDAGEREDGEHAGLPRPRAKATDVVSEAFTKEHLSEARDCREAAIVFQSRGGLVLEAGRDSHLGAVGTSASVCMVQGVDTAPPRHPPQPGKALLEGFHLASAPFHCWFTTADTAATGQLILSPLHC